MVRKTFRNVLGSHPLVKILVHCHRRIWRLVDSKYPTTKATVIGPDGAMASFL